MIERYDIVIVGGGMVGAALACALDGGPYRVALIEARPPREDAGRGEYDLRVSAVTRASERIFRAVGAWDGMAARRVSPFREMHVWDAAGGAASAGPQSGEMRVSRRAPEGDAADRSRGACPGAPALVYAMAGGADIHFDSAEIGEPYLGHIIENAVMQAALWERLRDISGVEVLCPAALRSLMLGDGSATVVLEDGTRLAARLVVGADGAGSRVRARAGIGSHGWAYDQQAVVATVRTEHPHRETAWQCFLPDGPLAFLPLLDGLSSIVWSTRPEHAAELAEMQEAAFRDALEQAFEGTLGRILEAGPRAVFPLALRQADAYVRPRIALVGDAAHTIHPLAGQGVNLGLLDAAALAEVLRGAQERDPGAYALLRRYERWRKGGNLGMMLVMDGFKRLFGSTLPPVRWARNAGLALTDAAGPVKRVIMERAMGLAGDLPPLARAAPRARGRGAAGCG